MQNLKVYFEEQLKNPEKTQFNIFESLHEPTDEMRLHSRFIASLLSAETGHGMENNFFKLFIEETLRIDFNYNNYSVKREFENIDILIYNDTQAIIIENKIYAGESNHLEREDIYRGQIERYYNTITAGINKDGKEIGIKREDVRVVYLTLDRHSPSDISKGNTPKEKILLIDYTEHIRDWITDCMKIIGNDCEPLSQILLQYKELITRLTSDVAKAKENQKILADHFEEALGLKNYLIQDCADIFNHVKWHIIALFFNDLECELQNRGCEIIMKPEPKDITKVVHNSGNSTKKLVISFTYNNTELFIANDRKGFTMGNSTKNKWGKFSEMTKVNGISMGDIKFSNFSNDSTFHIIDNKFGILVIQSMVDEILSKYDDLETDFSNIRPRK
ncbi:MAG: PD-(D/E)XK nuclease family protein [Dysgonamonadaceae bacterium]